MNVANMEEDEYVETSDVEELANAYGLLPNSDLGDVDSVMADRLTPKSPVVSQRGLAHYESPRKRRKLNHPFLDDTSPHVNSSRTTTPDFQTLTFQMSQNKVQPQVNVTAERARDVADISGKVKMKIHANSASQLPTSVRMVPQIELTIDEGSVILDDERQASWPTSSKSSRSQESPLHDYEGDLLDQFDQSLSPQMFSPQPILSHTTPRKSATQEAPSEDSEDELATVYPKSTSPLLASQNGSGGSRTRATSGHTPLSLQASSPPTPDEGMHPHAKQAENADARTSRSSSPGSSIAEGGNMNVDTVTRYPLRRRQPNQLHPYLYDEFQYKTVLKHNRDAIVDALRLHKRHVNQREDQYEEDGEYTGEDSQPQISPNHQVEIDGGHAQSPGKPLPAYIDALSESEGEADGLVKEARRIAREQRRREKEVKAMERQKRKEEVEKRRERQLLNGDKDANRKLKRFPISRASTHLERSNTTSAATQDAPPSRHNSHSRIPSISTSAIASSIESQYTDEEISELNALREYFMEDLRMGIEEEVIPVASQKPLPELPLQTPTPEPPEVIELDDYPSPTQNRRETESSDSDTQKDSHEDLSKRYPELFKLYPPGMARELLKKNKNKHRPKRLGSEDSMDEERLQPGQSRIRHGSYPKTVIDIRGDSESENSESEKMSMSPAYMYNGDIRNFLDHDTLDDTRPDRVVELPRFGDQPPASVPELIQILGEETSSSSGEEQVDDEDIQTLLGDDDGGVIYENMGSERGRVKEESMIDWMLSRTRVVGPTISKLRANRRGARKTGQVRDGSGTKASRTKYKVDVTIRGAHKHGNERQTLLDFANHASTRYSTSKDVRPKAGMATEPIIVNIPEPEASKRKSWKERRRERRERARLQGVYSMANPQTTGITSGRQKKPLTITIDLDDDDFVQSFVPHSQLAVSGSVKQSKPRKDPLAPHVDTSINQEQGVSNEHRERRRLTKRSHDLAGKCTIDMGIESLQPGTTFDPTSCIRQGYLQNSIDILTSDYAPPCPYPTYLCGISFGPSMEVDVLLQSLDKLFDGLQSFTSDIPSEGYEEALKDWGSLSRSACQHISWHRLQYSEDDRERLSSFLKGKVFSIVTSLKSRDIPASALNIALLSLCWLCIESSIRSGYRLYEETSEPQELNPTYVAIRLLLRYLVGYGLRKAYKAALKEQVLSETKMQCHAAQMWVYLLHVLPACDARRSLNLSQENPLWAELLLYYQTLPSANPLETGENMWKAAFTLIALSQFSPLGIVTSNLRLSASWGFISHAIKQVHPMQSSSNFQQLSQDTLQKRDEYIFIVICRCYRLLDYWKWKMNQSFGALNQLVHIFRARNFVNLRREEADYPDFMLDGNWDFLSQPCSKADSAFTLILKLSMRAVTSNCLTEAETKKMIALIIPVSKFRVQKEKIPGVNDLSPICNRFAALALAIGIEPGNATRAVNQVHSSIDFSSSDSTTQLLTIRGIKLLASLMIKRDVPLQEIAKWLTRIIKTVASEFKALKFSTEIAIGQQRENRNKLRNYSLLILSLYATGRAVMETFATENRYPEPAFLLAYKPFLEKECLAVIEEANCNLCEMRRFVESFLDARAAYLPLNEPILPNIRVDDLDSQDYGAFDFGIDLSDPTTLAQLEGPQHSFASIKDKEQGVDFQHKIIFQCFWVSRRKIQRFCEAAAVPIVDHDVLRTLDSWAHCLVGCMYILIQNGTLPDWSFCLNEITPIWNSVRVAWLQVRVRLSVLLEMIRYDPDPFFNLRSHELLEIFFESLAIPFLTTEPRFWRYIVAHELTSNPLFKDTAGPLTDPEIGITSHAPKVREVKLSMLRVLFGNIEIGIDETPNNPQVPTWINLCLKFFSMIRSIIQDFSDRPDEGAVYGVWCKDVLALLDNYPRLKNHQRMKTILDLLSRS